jgi:RNA polymerase sigma-70 factor (ECF subfamily)
MGSANSPDDGTLVAAARDGDRDARRKLYEATKPGIERLMVRMVGRQDAADLTQQVFLQAYRNLSQFSGRAKFSTWLYRLAVNEALQHLRRRKRFRFVSLDKIIPTTTPSDVTKCENGELLEQVLREIDPQLRAVFVLREIEELSYAEIAEAIGVAEGTVGSRLNRARKELQRRLTRLGWEPKT